MWGVGHATSDDIPDSRYDAMTQGQLRPLADSDPRQLGRFRVVGLLGEGGMGRVFLGSSPGGWAVAIKVIHAGLAADPAFRARFAHEVATARAVGGFYTAPVVDADTTAERPWLAVAYVAGPSLAEAVSAGGPLPPHAVLRLGLGLAEALQAIHAAGVIHRDLKPSNVLLAADGPRVIDFGIARAAEHSSLTRTGTILGSAGFMAPEQITGGEMGPAADVFALGAVLTFAATGQGPFGEGRTEALAYRVVYTEPTLEGLPDSLRDIVARCLAKDARHRPGPGEVITALAAIPVTGPGAGENWLPEPVERLVGLHKAVEGAAVTAFPASVPQTPTYAAPQTPTYAAPQAPPTYVPPQAPGYDTVTPTMTSLGTGPAGPAGPSPAVPPVPPPAAYPVRGTARRPRRNLVLGALALIVVLAVAGVVAVTELSAKAPAHGRTDGLAQGSSTAASRPATSAPPSPSPTPSPSPAATGPAAVVRAYYTAINAHDCGRAWSLGGNNISAARGQTYQQFCQGFSTTSHDALTVDSVSGNAVSVTIVAENTDGSSRTFYGSYVVTNGAIESASVRAAP
jgi:hypothetical protein